MGTIGGIIENVLLIKQEDINYLLKSGADTLLSIKENAVISEITFARDSLSYSSELEKTSSGNLYKRVLSGEKSPISEEQSAILDHWQKQNFIAVFEDKNGSCYILGDLDISCELSFSENISADFSENKYSISISSKSSLLQSSCLLKYV